MTVTVRLYPPLNDAAGREQITLAVAGQATIGSILERLAAQLGPDFRRYLYDDEHIIPAWCVFVNGQPVQLNRPASLETGVSDGDELAILLNVAGG